MFPPPYRWYIAMRGLRTSKVVGDAPVTAVKSTPVSDATAATDGADPPEITKSPGVKPSPFATRRTATPLSSSRFTARKLSFNFVLRTYPPAAPAATVPFNGTCAVTFMRSAVTFSPIGSTRTPMNSANVSVDMS